jgi:hypothetical protein
MHDLASRIIDWHSYDPTNCLEILSQGSTVKRADTIAPLVAIVTGRYEAFGTNADVGDKPSRVLFSAGGIPFTVCRRQLLARTNRTGQLEHGVEIAIGVDAPSGAAESRRFERLSPGPIPLWPSSE